MREIALRQEFARSLGIFSMFRQRHTDGLQARYRARIRARCAEYPFFGIRERHAQPASRSSPASDSH